MPRLDAIQMRVITDLRCVEYHRHGHPERPARISRSLEKLKAQKELPIAWTDTAPEAPDAAILRAHSEEHLKAVKNAVFDLDADTPAHPGIDGHSRRAAGGALAALKAARAGEHGFSLLRPPGHHATRDTAMGFCYFNSIAIAVLEAVHAGAGKVAVFDFDVHHGNGTEAILLDQPDCAFFSVHQFPAYPGTGQRHRNNCYNYPVKPGADRKTYRAALTQAMDEMRRFKPDIIAVSAGFDAYKDDPLSDEPLEAEDYLWLGESVKGFGVPAFSVLEGGYSDALPDLIFSYLKGLEGKK